MFRPEGIERLSVARAGVWCPRRISARSSNSCSTPSRRSRTDAAAHAGFTAQELAVLSVDELTALEAILAKLEDARRGQHGSCATCGTHPVDHAFSARIMESPAGLRAATELLAILSGTTGPAGDAG